MKKILNILFAALITIGFFACDPQEAKVKDLGDVVATEDIKVTITEDAEASNLYHFQLTTPACIGGIFKGADAGIDYTGMKFSQKIRWAGDYQIQVQVYNKAGISEAKTITLNVAQNDPAMYDDKNLMNLTGGDAGKVWVVDSTVGGHIGCGPTDASTPSWWSANPNELADRNIYDDELSFVLSKESDYKLVTNGKIFVNESAVQTMDPVGYPNGSSVAVVVNYTQPSGQTYTLMEEGSKLYIKFSDKGFPSYVANPSALGARYEVTELTENTMHLKWIGSGIIWYYKFKVK